MACDEKCRDWRLVAALIWAAVATFACAFGWVNYVHGRMRSVPDFESSFDEAFRVYHESKDPNSRENAQAMLMVWVLRAIEALRSPRDYFEATYAETYLQRIHDASK